MRGPAPFGAPLLDDAPPDDGPLDDTPLEDAIPPEDPAPLDNPAPLDDPLVGRPVMSPPSIPTVSRAGPLAEEKG